MSRVLLIINLILIVVVVCLSFAVHISKKSKERIKAELNETLETNKLLTDTLKRTTKACNVYVDGVSKAHAEKDERTNKLYENACEWNDDLLPDSILQLFGVCENNSGAAGAHDALQEGRDAANENK